MNSFPASSRCAGIESLDSLLTNGSFEQWALPLMPHFLTGIAEEQPLCCVAEELSWQYAAKKQVDSDAYKQPTIDLAW